VRRPAQASEWPELVGTRHPCHSHRLRGAGSGCDSPVLAYRTPSRVPRFEAGDEPGGRALSLTSVFFAHWCVHPKSQALTHFGECFRLRLAVGFGLALASGLGAGFGSAVSDVGTLLAESL
jgi:hypothetical protein